MAKQKGHGTLVKVDHDGDTNYTTVGCANQITPPPRNKEPIDATCMEDQVEDFVLGIEEGGDLVFSQFWHPGLANHEIIDSLFGSEAEVNWRVVYPFATPVTDTFPGIVINISPEQIESKSIISRQVTVRRTGPITRT